MVRERGRKEGGMLRLNEEVEGQIEAQSKIIIYISLHPPQTFTGFCVALKSALIVHFIQ